METVHSEDLYPSPSPPKPSLRLPPRWRTLNRGHSGGRTTRDLPSVLRLHKLLRRQLVALKYLDDLLRMDSVLKNVQNVQVERLNSKADVDRLRKGGKRRKRKEPLLLRRLEDHRRCLRMLLWMGLRSTVLYEGSIGG